MTIASWIRPDSVSGVGDAPVIIVSSDNGGADWSLGLKGGFPFIRSGKLELTTPQQTYAGEWMHLVFSTHRNRNRKFTSMGFPWCLTHLASMIHPRVYQLG